MTESTLPAKLTVLVPCKDECLNIRPCIESFQEIADEILIADSGSSDGTLDIVRQIGGCRVIEREYVTSGDFKNWAIPQASHEWILLVDADERVTPELAEEIRVILSGSVPTLDAYWIFRDNHFLGHRIHHAGWDRDKVIRLFQRDLSHFDGPSDHGELTISSGRVGRLRGRLLHYTYWDYDQLIRKFNRYTTLQAQQWYDEGIRPSYLRLFGNPIFRFLKAFFLQRGILDGAAGLQVSMLAGYYSYLKQARLWELYYAIPQPNPEEHRTPSSRKNSSSVATIEKAA